MFPFTQTYIWFAFQVDIKKEKDALSKKGTTCSLKKPTLKALDNLRLLSKVCTFLKCFNGVLVTKMFCLNISLKSSFRFCTMLIIKNINGFY